MNAKKRNAVLSKRFFDIRNHVLYTSDLDDCNDESKLLFDNYRDFVRLMRRNACDHTRHEKRVERRQLRANDESATLFVVCEGCDGIIKRY